MNEVRRLLSEYYQWLNDNTHIEESSTSEWISIDTPFVGIFNDHIEIYVKRQGDDWILSDGSETLILLEDAGLKISRSPNRKDYLAKIIRNHGLNLNEASGEIYVMASPKEFFKKKHSLIQGLLAIHDLSAASQQNVKNFFKDDVESFLSDGNIIYTKNIKFAGASGLDWDFDFLIPTRRKEFVLKTVSLLTQNATVSFSYAINDVRAQRQSDKRSKYFEGMVVINDSYASPRPEFVSTLRNENINVVYWSSKDVINQIIQN